TVSESQLVTDLVLTDTLGTGLDLGTVTPVAPFTCNSANPLACTLPAGTVPGTYTVSYTATVNAAAVGTVNNAVVGNQGDCEVDCDIETPVEEPSVTYNKTSDPETGTLVIAGQTVTYTLSVLVENSATSGDVVLTDTFSGAQTLTGTLPEGCAGNADGLACTLPAGTVPGTYTFTYATVVDADAVGTIGNVVVATGDDEPTCEVCSTEHPVANPAIDVEKVATLTTDNGTLGVGNTGDVITYAVTVTNTGDITLNDIVVVDTFNGGTPTTLTCSPLSLAPGETATCDSYTHTITAEEAGIEGGVLVNVV